MKEQNVHHWQSFANENNSLDKLFEPLSKRLTECGCKDGISNNSSDSTLKFILALRSCQGFNAQDYSLSDGSVIKLNASVCNDFSLQEQEQINASLASKGVFIVQV